MADDIRIIWDDDLFEGDLGLEQGDLVREPGLRTAIYMSLFTDRRAPEDAILPDDRSTDRKGWWGDLIAEEGDDQIGSLLWLLSRSKTTRDTLTKAESYIKDALAWLVEDGVAVDYSVEVERQNLRDKSARLAVRIRIFKSDGVEVALDFDDLWNAQLASSEGI